jgi:hypothetical protein
MLTFIISHDLLDDVGIIELTKMLKTMNDVEVIFIQTPGVSVEQVVEDLKKANLCVMPFERVMLDIIQLSKDKSIGVYYSGVLSRGHVREIWKPQPF